MTWLVQIPSTLSSRIPIFKIVALWKENRDFHKSDETCNIGIQKGFKKATSVGIDPTIPELSIQHFTWWASEKLLASLRRLKLFCSHAPLMLPKSNKLIGAPTGNQ